MIYIVLILTSILIIAGAEYVRRFIIKHKKSISFKESLDLTGIPIITFRQGNKKFNFILDTGATVSTIDSRVLQDIDYKIVEGMEGSVFGMEGNIQTVKFAEIELERDIKYYGQFQIIDMSQAFDAIKQECGVTLVGLIGNDFFQKYKYILDYELMIAYPNL